MLPALGVTLPAFRVAVTVQCRPWVAVAALGVAVAVSPLGGSSSAPGRVPPAVIGRCRGGSWGDEDI